MASATSATIQFDPNGIKAINRLAKAIEHQNLLTIEKGRHDQSVSAETLPPPPEGTYEDIGPEAFTNGLVISYKGANYYKACDEFVADTLSGGQEFCVKRVNHGGFVHEAYDGTQRDLLS